MGKFSVAVAGALCATSCIGGDDNAAFADGGTAGTAGGVRSTDTTAGVTRGSVGSNQTQGGGGGSETGSNDSPPADSGEGGTTTDTSATGPGGGSSSSGGPTPECFMDRECDPGFLCIDQACQPGCNATQVCPGADACCQGQCVDTDTSMEYCGACDTPCEPQDNQPASCALGLCTLGDCDDGFFDCDGMGSTGCESEIACACVPGAIQDCYPFNPITLDVGPCTSGSQTCNAAGTAWGACFNFVGPVAEICDNAVDDDCNGAADDFVDIDGDGWTVCDNDCCEDSFGCSDPELVNPGAFEVLDNDVDDDCDPLTSDTIAPDDCSTTSSFGGVTPVELAEAMDLCQFTTLAEPLATRKWGVLNAELVLADGTAPSLAQLTNMEDAQTAVLTDYGTGGIAPVVGGTMAGLSSGWMRDVNDPGYAGVATSFGYNTSLPPAGYLAANGGTLPSSAGCSGACPSGAGANDSVNLRLTIRVPTNALSFRYRLRFFSAEYLDWACTIYNDFYLGLLQTGAAGIPADGNISFDGVGNPISVNNGFFDICVPNGCYACPQGAGELAGTGLDVGNLGGATVWLETTAPVVPGEDMVLELVLFDVSDDWLDSMILLDGFEWDLNASGVGTAPQ